MKFFEPNSHHDLISIPGGRSQEQREASLQGFRDDKYNVLVATDVAGRGIDVPDVALVVNFEMPDKIEPYTHRIGRTGRAGRKGIAVTLLTPNDTGVYYDLVKLLTESRQQVGTFFGNFCKNVWRECVVV